MPDDQVPPEERRLRTTAEAAKIIGTSARSLSRWAAEGKVRAHIHRTTLEGINAVFDALKAGRVDGRIVLDMTL